MAEADLLEAYCAWADGSGSPDAEAAAGDALAALLRRGPAVRRELVEYALLDAALYRMHLVPPPPLPWWRRPLGPGGYAIGVVFLAAIIGGAVAWQRRDDGQGLISQSPPRVVAMVAGGELRVAGKPSSDVLTLTDLEVSPDAPATIRLRDGSTILLHPGSQLRMRGLDDVDRGFQFDFQRGGADFRLVPGHRELGVVTPFGSVEATGPNFTVSIDQANRKLQFAGPLRPYGLPPPLPPGR